MADPETIVREHQHAVYNLARRLTGSADTAGEITQEAFLRLLGMLARGRNPGGTRSYLYRTVLNLCADRWRRLGRETLLDGELPAGVTAQPEWQAAHRELAGDVRRAVSELPLLYRQVVILRYYQELSYEEIARVLGWPLSLVRNRLYRARQRLRDRLDGEGEEARRLAGAMPG
ncbi:MAG: RNA polymerase sigma factor [bacterium]|nr:RNA polymerase sigma factor [bacterium]